MAILTMRSTAAVAPAQPIPADSEFAKRAIFIGLTVEHLVTVRGFARLLLPELPRVLAVVERRLRSVPALDGSRAGDAAFRQLVELQGQAWRLIYEGAVDERMDAVIAALGDQLGAMGIDTAWYTAAYSAAFNEVLDLAIRRGGGNVGQTVLLVQGLTLLSAADRGLLVALQVHKAKAHAAARLDHLTRVLEREVAVLVERFTLAAGDLRRIAETMSLSARRTEDGAAAVSSGADETRQCTERASAAAEELSAAIRAIDAQLLQSRHVADKALAATATAYDTIAALASNTDRIESVTKLIGSIASRTRLLALNANIEAARAGSAGQGFTVVANEIKTLAGQTSRATDEIAAQLGEMQRFAQDSVRAVQSVTGIIQTVHAVTADIAASVEQQAAATRAIAHAIERAAQGTGAVSRDVGQVFEATRNAGSDARDVLTAASSLAAQCALLTEGVEHFLTEIRAA